MKNIIIAPYPQKLRNGKPNPKEYPYWKEVVKGLKERGYFITQVGVEGEAEIEGVDQFLKNLSMKELEKMTQECVTWLTVDSFFQHLARYKNKPGIVLFSISDPLIFGHPANLNLLKSRNKLRTYQFATWEEAFYDSYAFMDPKIVLSKFDEFIKKLN